MKKTIISLWLILLFTSCKTTSITGHTQTVVFARQQVILNLPITGYDTTVINGLLWLPPDYNSSNTYPLIIALSGNGETTYQKVVNNNTGAPAVQIARGWNATAINPNTGLTEEFIVWSPAIFDLPGAGNNAWFNSSQVKQQLNWLEATYSINTNKVFITGLSAGGYATLTGVCDDITLIPRFAAAAPTSPVGDGRFETELSRTITYSVPLFFSGGLGNTSGGGDAQYSTAVKYAGIVNALNPPIPALLYGVKNGTHSSSTWDTIYNPAKKFTVTGGMNLYEWFLNNSRTTIVSNTITTGSISGSPFCLTASTGASISVSFTSTGTFTSNTYTLQLSDINGNFGSPTNIGSLTSNANSGTISATLPANSATSGSYKVRVISSNPATVGSASSSFRINLASNSIAPSQQQNTFVGANGATLTVTDQSTASAHQWFANGIAIAGATASSYVPNFNTAGVRNITCQSTFACGVITSNSVTINVQAIASSKVYITPNSGCGVYRWSSGNPGDTLVLQAKYNPYCFINFYEIHGTPAKHITIIAEGGVILNTGSLSLLNCTYVDINFGSQLGLPTASINVKGTTYSAKYGYESDGSGTAGGAGFEIRGISNHITFSNMYIHDRGKLGLSAGYSVIIKNDPNDHPNNNVCDNSWAFPTSFSNITGFNIVSKNISQDGFYLGSSIGYNPNQQPQNCNGVITYPRPASLDSCLFYNCYFDNIGRSAFQAGQMIKGNIFHDNAAVNLGYEINSSQGAFFACGNPDSSLEIYNNVCNRTYKPAAYSYIYGLWNVHNNNFDSSGWVLDTNGILQTQSVCNIELYPQNNTYSTPMQFIIKNNILGAHKNPAANIALFVGGSNNYAQSGNEICGNVGQVIYNSGVTAPFSTCVTNTLNTNNVSPTTYCVTQTVGSNITVTGTSTGTFNANNVYTAQLSDASGNFASAVNIGSVNSTSNTISISAIIPANTPASALYKIRIISSSPSITSSSSNSFTVNLTSNSIAPTSTQNILTNNDGSILTATESGGATSRQWLSNGSTIFGQTGLTYTPRFGTAGTYTITLRSTYPCGTVTSNGVTIIVSDPPPPPPDSTFAGTVTGSPFCVSSTATAAVNVPYTSNRAFYNSGNTFTVQLSNANGSFNSPVTIGTSTTTSASGTIASVIPVNTPTGSQYRVRVVSSNPTSTAVVNTNSLTINLASNNITPSATQNILVNTNGQILTVNEGSTSISRNWFYGTFSHNYVTNTGISANTFTPNFSTSGSYYVVCVSTFACETDTSNEVLIQVSDPTPPPPDTVCSTTKIQHDTIVTVPKTVRIPYDSTVIIPGDSIGRKVYYAKLKLHATVYAPEKTIVYHKFRDTTYDTTYHMITPLHDTTICTQAYNLGAWYFNPFGAVPIATVIDTLKNYIGVGITRYNNMRDGGSNYVTNMNAFRDSGIDVILTMQNSSEGAAGYKNWVDTTLPKSKIPVIGTPPNEPTVNYASMANVISETQDVVDEMHKYGGKAADGGMTKDIVYYIVDYWDNNGKSDSATWLRQTLHLNMSSPTALLAIRQYDSLFTAYKLMDLDYANFHFYEPASTDKSVTTLSNLLPIVSNFILQQLPNVKGIISNEFGTFNTSCTLLTNLTAQAVACGFSYLIYFDGNGSEAIKNQDCYKTIISNYR